jgi:hypothetical protein
MPDGRWRAMLAESRTAGRRPAWSVRRLESGFDPRDR